MIALPNRQAAAETAIGCFARLHGAQFHVWSPPGSPARVEYSASLLREVHLEAAGGDAWGMLYGKRIEGGFQLVAARVPGHENDPLLAGLEPVGIFAARIRGEVFLTESDLQRFENLNSHRKVALVVAGEKAGFFAHEPDGSIQSVRSYGEFPAPQPEMPKLRAWRDVLIVMGLLALAALAFLPPHRRTPVALRMRHANGQLSIAWNRAGMGTLAIIDGGERVAIPVSPDLVSATYQLQSGDVQIELRRADGSHEQARFIGRDTVQRARRVSGLEKNIR